MPAVVGHVWGQLDDAFSKSRERGFTRILAADCLWMPGEHQNLARSMLHFLSDDEGARVWVVAGFHTGREKLALFFHVAEEVGMTVDDIYEVDVAGNRRSWAEERQGESLSERKRWLVISTLLRSKV